MNDLLMKDKPATNFSYRSIMFLIMVISMNNTILFASDKLKDGFIGVMPSSHQDIAWEDTPANCDLIREKIFLNALKLMEENSQYRYMIEDCYIARKFLELNPGSEIKSGKSFGQAAQLEIGATYTMPNESLFSGEVLARQFYFGQRWLQDTFGHTSVLSSNVDLPGESIQYPQLADKAGVQLRILDKNKPFRLFKWESPDGSQVVYRIPAAEKLRFDAGV